MFYWKIHHLKIRNCIRDPSGIFSISSPVNMTSFPVYPSCLFKQSVCLYDKKKFTRSLKMQMLFSHVTNNILLTRCARLWNVVSPTKTKIHTFYQQCMYMIWHASRVFTLGILHLYDGEDDAYWKMCLYFTLEFHSYLELSSVSVDIKTCPCWICYTNAFSSE